MVYQIAQIGSPDQIYHRPVTRFVADFIGLPTFVPAELKAPAGGKRWTVSCGVGEQVCTSEADHAPGQAVLLAIRPERVQISADRPEQGNGFEARLRNAYFLGPCSESFLDAGDLTVRAQQTNRVDVHPGQRLFAYVAPEHCLVVAHSPDGAREP